VDVAMGQIPRSTERISSFVDNSLLFPTVKNFQNRLTVEVVAKLRHHVFETQL